MTSWKTNPERPQWPLRAVVTAGMPYGNKPLHFGHIGGVFVPADAYARFLRDRLGANNVRFVCGTDCFGSPIDEGYRKLVEAGEFTGTIADYVQRNHDAQAATLAAYDISLDIFEGSGIGLAGEIHQEMTTELLTTLHANGWMSLDSTLQFYDAQAETFLNGRQVVGRCPVQGCKSEKAYADECDLGHQYSPEDLIAPISSVTGTTPEMRPVENWYFDLPAFTEFLRTLVDGLEADPEIRPVVAQTTREFLAPPIIYIKNELEDAYRAIAPELPAHVFRAAEKGKQSFELEFTCIADRDAARPILGAAGIRYRTGKALVPFRLTGNIEWGVKAPELDGVTGLTVWCWPESLWAPISFTSASLVESGRAAEEWREFWCSDDACVYQFIGQDNLYFYGIAQPALWQALQVKRADGEGATDATNALPLAHDACAFPLHQSRLIANHHVLLGKKKASSSSAVKPPTADELLNYYTAEQLRAHFLALGLDQKSVGFCPKPFDPDPEKREDPRVADPALKEGALLTNVFNRLARSCFYEAAKSFDGRIPIGEVSPDVKALAQDALLRFELLMHKAELHSVMSCVDELIRKSNKYWADGISAAEKIEDEEAREEARRVVLRDSAYLLRVCTLAMHPIVPSGCESICEFFDFAPEEFFSWNGELDSLDELCVTAERTVGFHTVKELPPRFDFFRKHESQFK